MAVLGPGYRIPYPARKPGLGVIISLCLVFIPLIFDPLGERSLTVLRRKWQCACICSPRKLLSAFNICPNVILHLPCHFLPRLGRSQSRPRRRGDMFIYPTRNYNQLDLLTTPHNIHSSPLHQLTLLPKTLPQPISPRAHKPPKILRPEQHVIISHGCSNRCRSWRD